MNPEDITSEALAGTDVHNDIVVSDGQEAVGDGTNALTLEEVAKTLGKDFKDKESFLKSVKDTYAYVGKAGQDSKKLKELEMKLSAKEEVKAIDQTGSLANELRALKNDLFYRDNPQYASYRGVIEKIGGNPADVVNSAEFKPFIEKAIGYDKVQQNRSVLESNPRIAASSSKLQDAAKAMRSGQHDAAADSVASAVMEAYGIN